MNNNVDISVIVLTYNPNLEDLCNTLKSIVVQKDINFEIVISDDGSSIFDEITIKKFFESNQFDNYCILRNENNQGTVINALEGVKRANAEYVKLISPGDCLYKCDVLYKIYSDLKETENGFLFGNAIYYKKDNNNDKFEILGEKKHPIHFRLYEKDSVLYRILAKENYVILNDVCLGAATAGNRQLFLEYLCKIEGKIKYGEDSIYRLMMVDNIRYSYLNTPIIWYQYGTGVSTNKNSFWSIALNKDLEAGDKIIESSLNHDFFHIRFRLMMKLKRLLGKKSKYFIFPEMVLLKIKYTIEESKKLIKSK